MSTIINHQFISYLIQHGVSDAIIKILDKQRISDGDLLAIDRDDIEHLFKSEYGFTFGDRKRLWNTIQKFQSENTKNDILHIKPDDEVPDIYDVTDDERSNYDLKRHYASSSSNVPSSAPVYNRSTDVLKEIVFTKSSSGNNDDSLKLITTSLSVSDQFPRHSQPKTSITFKFRYPVELPIFSPQAMNAFGTNHTKSEWDTLIKEIVQWILTKELYILEKSEYQAIGKTLFKLYPNTARDGFRPWSYLCRCITTGLGKERCRQGLQRLQRLN